MWHPLNEYLEKLPALLLRKHGNVYLRVRRRPHDEKSAYACPPLKIAKQYGNERGSGLFLVLKYIGDCKELAEIVKDVFLEEFVKVRIAAIEGFYF